MTVLSPSAARHPVRKTSATTPSSPVDSPGGNQPRDHAPTATLHPTSRLPFWIPKDHPDVATTPLQLHGEQRHHRDDGQVRHRRLIDDGRVELRTLAAVHDPRRTGTAARAAFVARQVALAGSGPRRRLGAVGEFGWKVEVGEALLRAIALDPRCRPPGRGGVDGVRRLCRGRLAGRRLRRFSRRTTAEVVADEAGEFVGDGAAGPWIARMRNACHVASSTLTRAVCCSRWLMTVAPVASPRRRVDGSHEGASLWPDLGSHGRSADVVR
jgi:hypothetical protein